MNKFKMLFITLLLVLVFSGCGNNDTTDIIAPVFGPLINTTIDYGEVFDPMEHVTVTDNIDGDITSDVECTIFDSYFDEAFDSNVTDVYTQTCTVSDTAGNTASAERTITVQNELIGAVISGVEDKEISYGVYFDPMADLEIIDKLDGNITRDVVVSIYYADSLLQVELVDTSQMRSYYIDYVILNSLGIETELRVLVEVIDNLGPVITLDYILDFYNGTYHSILNYVSATDNLDDEVRGITYTVYDSSNAEFEILSDRYFYGDFTVLYEVTDEAGNVGTLEVPMIIRDSYYPVISFVTEKFVIGLGDTVDIEGNFSVTDESDEDLVVSFEIENMTTSTIVDAISQTEYGFYEVRVVATDGSGNTRTEHFTVAVTTGTMVYVDIETVIAGQQLFFFYNYLGYVSYTNEDVCKMYVTDVPFDVNMTYEECVSKAYVYAELIENYTKEATTAEVIGGIKYYTTVYKHYRPEGDIFKSVTTHFVSYEYSNNIYMVFDNNPFDLDSPYEVYHPVFEEIDDELSLFYDNMLSNTLSTHVEFCELYVIGTIGNTMTINDCEEFVDAIDGNIVTLSRIEYDIISYEAVSIPFSDGEILEGYEAVIDISKTEFEQTVTVQFIFFQHGTEQSIFFVDGFFSSEFDYNLKFINQPGIGYDGEVTEFYDALLSNTITPTQFCEDHYMGSPIEGMDFEHCIIYVEKIRGEGITYTINGITDITLEAFNGTVDAHRLDITFVDDGIDQNLLINFVIVQGGNGYSPIFFDIYMVNLNFDEELDFALVSGRSQTSIINGFYADVLDSTMSDTSFCNKYLVTGGIFDMPLSEYGCGAVRLNITRDSSKIELIGIVYQDLGDPEFPPVYLVDMKVGTSKLYTAEFTIYYDPLGNLIIKVNLNDAFGGGFE